MRTFLVAFLDFCFASDFIVFFIVPIPFYAMSLVWKAFHFKGV